MSAKDEPVREFLRQVGESLQDTAPAFAEACTATAAAYHMNILDYVAVCGRLQGMGRPKSALLIIDDPAPVEPPTAEQLAARRKFCDEHCDPGDLDLPPLHWHEDDLCSRLLKGDGQ